MQDGPVCRPCRQQGPSAQSPASSSVTSTTWLCRRPLPRQSRRRNHKEHGLPAAAWTSSGGADRGRVGPQRSWSRLAPFVYRVAASRGLCHPPRWLSPPPERSPHAVWGVPGTSVAPPAGPPQPSEDTRPLDMRGRAGSRPWARPRAWPWPWEATPCQLLAQAAGSPATATRRRALAHL